MSESDAMESLCEHLRRVRHIIVNKVPYTAPEAMGARWEAVGEEVAGAERAILALARERRAVRAQIDQANAKIRELIDDAKDAAP